MEYDKIEEKIFYGGFGLSEMGECSMLVRCLEKKFDLVIDLMIPFGRVLQKNCVTIP